jgi:uncharacterized iron-regulated membrane protein
MKGKWMRIIHRYLGFFLAGIMAMYALSGVLMIFRTTDFLKEEKHIQKTIEPGLSAEGLGPALKIKLQVEKEEGNLLYFKNGKYNKATGEADYTVKELPTLLHKMEGVHKATVNSPLYFLNIFFGFSLLFFVISTFWMFAPKTKIFKKGLWFTAGRIVLTLILLYV